MAIADEIRKLQKQTQKGLSQMEANAAAALAGKATPPKVEKPNPIWEVTLAPPGRTRVAFICVGAGGVGARIIPALSQMARRGDVIKVVDHDIVETRNLHRQHFAPRDVGQHKASVMARRYSKEHTTVQAFDTAVEKEKDLYEVFRDNGECFIEHDHTPTQCVVIGAIDNAAARIAVKKGVEYLNAAGTPTFYIDIGNEMRGGQVLIASARWAGKAVDMATGNRTPMCNIVLTGHLALPNLWEPPPAKTAEELAAEEETRCAARVDLQTVVVNNMGACIALNYVNSLLSGLPFSSLGTFFSTLNSTSPVPLIRGTADNSYHGYIDFIAKQMG